MSSQPIKYRLKSASTPGPNCMFRVKRPDMGMVGEGYIIDVLIDSCIKWRKANGIPIGLTFEQDLINLVCQQHPDICVSDDPRAPLKPKALDLKTVVRGTKVMTSWAMSGFQSVLPGIAEHRASICAGCKFNVRHTFGCGGICGELLSLASKFVNQKTTYDSKLHACQLCGCRLEIAVWLPREMQWDPMDEHTKAVFVAQAPETCWKKPS